MDYGERDSNPILSLGEKVLQKPSLTLKEGNGIIQE